MELVLLVMLAAGFGLIVLDPANWIRLGRLLVPRDRREKFDAALQAAIASEQNPQLRQIYDWAYRRAVGRA